MTTWELPIEEVLRQEAKVAEEKVSPLEIVKEYATTLKNRSFRKHLAIYLLSFTGKDTFNTVFAYFCTFCLGLTATVAANMLSLSIVGLLVTFVAGYLMIKRGPKFLYVSGYGLMLVMLVAYFCLFVFRPSHLIAWLFVVSLLYQIGRATLEFTPWNVFPFIPDIDELVTGRNRAGEFAAVMTFCRKTTVAVASIATGWILDRSGFVHGAQTQTPGVQMAIALVLMLFTGTLIVLALLVALTFKVNPANHEIVRNELERLKNGGSKADADAKTRMIVEQLSGTPYDRAWPVER